MNKLLSILAKDLAELEKAADTLHYSFDKGAADDTCSA